MFHFSCELEGFTLFLKENWSLAFLVVDSGFNANVSSRCDVLKRKMFINVCVVGNFDSMEHIKVFSNLHFFGANGSEFTIFNCDVNSVVNI